MRKFLSFYMLLCASLAFGQGSIATGNPVATANVKNVGVFTNTQANEYLTSLIGGCDSSATYGSQEGKNPPTDAIDGCMTIPSSSTASSAFGVVGMVNNNSVVTGGAGAYFQAVGTVANPTFPITGAAALSTMNCPLPCRGGKIEGFEIDVGPGNSNAAVGQIYGLLIAGGTGGGAVPTGAQASAININPHLWSWHNAISAGRGASDTFGLFLDGTSVSNPSASQIVGFQSYNSGGTHFIQELFGDSSGNFNIARSGTKPQLVNISNSSVSASIEVFDGVPSGACTNNTIGINAAGSSTSTILYICVAGTSNWAAISQR